MNSQFKRGIIELLVLKVVKDKQQSSFDVIENLSQKIDVTENTIYPILRRLTKQGYFENESTAGSVGAPRKIYSITESGKTKLTTFQNEWEHFLKQVLDILGGDQ